MGAAAAPGLLEEGGNLPVRERKRLDREQRQQDRGTGRDHRSNERGDRGLSGRDERFRIALGANRTGEHAQARDTERTNQSRLAELLHV